MVIVIVGIVITALILAALLWPGKPYDHKAWLDEVLAAENDGRKGQLIHEHPEVRSMEITSGGFRCVSGGASLWDGTRFRIPCGEYIFEGEALDDLARG